MQTSPGNILDRAPRHTYPEKGDWLTVSTEVCGTGLKAGQKACIAGLTAKDRQVQTLVEKTLASDPKRLFQIGDEKIPLQELAGLRRSSSRLPLCIASTFVAALEAWLIEEKILYPEKGDWLTLRTEVCGAGLGADQEPYIAGLRGKDQEVQMLLEKTLASDPKRLFQVGDEEIPLQKLAGLRQSGAQLPFCIFSTFVPALEAWLIEEKILYPEKGDWLTLCMEVCGNGLRADQKPYITRLRDKYQKVQTLLEKTLESDPERLFLADGKIVPLRDLVGFRRSGSYSPFCIASTFVPALEAWLLEKQILYPEKGDWLSLNVEICGHRLRAGEKPHIAGLKEKSQQVRALLKETLVSDPGRLFRVGGEEKPLKDLVGLRHSDKGLAFCVASDFVFALEVWLKEEGIPCGFLKIKEDKTVRPLGHGQVVLQALNQAAPDFPEPLADDERYDDACHPNAISLQQYLLEFRSR